MAFARHLARLDDAQLQRAFNQQLVDSMSQDVLRSLLETADFGTGPTAISGLGGGARVQNADIAMLGAGNVAQSVIEIHVHKVEPIEAKKLEALAKQVGPAGVGPVIHAQTFAASADASAHRMAQLETDLRLAIMTMRRRELAQRLRQARRKKRGENEPR